MRRVDMPVTNLRRFVVVEIEVRAQLNFLQPIEIKPEIDRGVVSRIAADDDKRLDFADVDVSNEFAQRLHLIDGVGGERICIEDSLADIAESFIHDMCERMNAWRLVITDDYN